MLESVVKDEMGVDMKRPGSCPDCPASRSLALENLLQISQHASPHLEEKSNRKTCKVAARRLWRESLKT